MEYARHVDTALRREAIRSLLKRDETRERAILVGLRDSDVRIFHLALGAMTGVCTMEAARAIISRLENPELSDELRARSIRALADAREDEVRRWLEKRATSRHWLFRSLRLRKPSLELYAVLTALATRNEHHPESQRIVELARRSRNPEVRRAAMARITAQPSQWTTEDQTRFLISLAQALAKMSLYAEGHPTRATAADASLAQLRQLQQSIRIPGFHSSADPSCTAIAHYASSLTGTGPLGSPARACSVSSFRSRSRPRTTALSWMRF